MSHQLFNIQLQTQKYEFECSSSESILAVGLRHGLAMRYRCENGSCGVCTAKLISGKIKQIKNHDFVLSNKQKHNNEFLMCCNSPKTDSIIDVDLIGDTKSIAIQNIKTKVKKVVFINDDLAILTLRTPRSKTLQFMAGQDVKLSFKDTTSRYPIASCPCHGIELEFHIRNIKTDQFASALFSKKIKVRSKVKLKGPKGIFVLNKTSTRPMFFIAWDIGFAAIRSLIEHAFSSDMPNQVYFYWAYHNNESVPYLDKYAKSWQTVMDHFIYTTIPCKYDRNSKKNYKKVAQQIFNALDMEAVNNSDVYISAPAQVLISLSQLLIKNGLDEKQLKASPV